MSGWIQTKAELVLVRTVYSLTWRRQKCSYGRRPPTQWDENARESGTLRQWGGEVESTLEQLRPDECLIRSAKRNL
jgi:hypothetical protein